MTDEKDSVGKEGITAFLNPEEMHKLNRLVLNSRYVVEGNLAGAHRSPLKGASSEFADHKSYGLGDDPKHIDWRVFGRTEKHYIKRYEDDTNLRVYLAIDRSKSMGYASEEKADTKFRYACRLAAAIGYVTVKARDSVGMYVHADDIDAVMPARNSLNHLNNSLKTLQTFEPGSTTEIAGALDRIAGSVRHRALVVVISDLLGDQDAINLAFAHLRKRKHDVIVLQVLDPFELDLGFKKNCKVEDLETEEKLVIDPRRLRASYNKVFGEFLSGYRQACAGMKIDYRIARTDEPLDVFVRAYLEERRRMSK
ncbi:MAG: hypothetical protein ACI9QL_003599 [Candidatus Omnitrophota bacterium]|jgi:uncharacterized protein (DUF58 family)